MSDPFHQRPWTMGFADAEMERRYIEEQARVTRGPMRAALAVVAVMWLVLALTVDRLLFPPATGIMHTLRAGSEVVFALAAAFVSFGSSKAYLRWWQLVLDVTTLVAALYPTAVGLALTATFGRELDAVWPTVHLQWLISVTLAIVAAHVLCRFAHATSISVVATAAYLVALVLARAAGPDLAGDAFWLVVANALGMIGSRHTEAQRRLAWSQTQLLDVERVRSEQLLLNVLPPSIAERLKCGERRIADAAAEVTVLFADIVGFTVLSQRVGAEELVSTLDDVFSAFDEIAERHGLEKIKTIGDAYMVVGGLPLARTDHAVAVAEMALGMRAFIRGCGLDLKIRIGMHTGPVVAGVIGKRKFSYDVWGDTVNTASRMESHGIEDEIQVSDATARRLRAVYVLDERGAIPIKGKGEMSTWLLRCRAP